MLSPCNSWATEMTKKEATGEENRAGITAAVAGMKAVEEATCQAISQVAVTGEVPVAKHPTGVIRHSLITTMAKTYRSNRLLRSQALVLGTILLEHNGYLTGQM